jgi:hypothetical protein
MRHDDDRITCGVLPFSFSDFDPNDDRPALPSVQREALTDIQCQLVTHLVIAAKDKTDPFKAIRTLANCQKILAEYAAANFDLLAAYQHELKTNLRSALREARRTFFREAFLSRSMEEFATYKQVMLDAGWRTSHSEALEDYNTVVAEMFDGDFLRPSALEERRRRSHA